MLQISYDEKFSQESSKVENRYLQIEHVVVRNCRRENTIRLNRHPITPKINQTG